MPSASQQSEPMSAARIGTGWLGVARSVFRRIARLWNACGRNGVFTLGTHIWLADTVNRLPAPRHSTAASFSMAGVTVSATSLECLEVSCICFLPVISSNLWVAAIVRAKAAPLHRSCRGQSFFDSVRQDEFAHRSKGPVTDRNLLGPIGGPSLLLCARRTARLGRRE
jgi:hypothetical protein